jgi:hypothetical protein
MKKRGPGEQILRHPGPGEQKTTASGDGSEPDVEGHGIGDSLNRPLDGLTGPSTSRTDGVVHLPRTGGEDIPDFGPDSR